MQASKLITIGLSHLRYFEGTIRDDERAGKSSKWDIGYSDPKKK